MLQSCGALRGEPFRSLLQLGVHGGLGIETHFHEAGHIGRITVLRFVLIQLALRIVGAAKDVIEGNIKVVSNPNKQFERRRCLSLFVANNAGLSKFK